MLMTDRSISFLPAWNDGIIRVFAPESGRLMISINNAHRMGVTAIAGTRDSKRMVSGGGDGQVSNRQHQIALLFPVSYSSWPTFAFIFVLFYYRFVCGGCFHRDISCWRLWNSTKPPWPASKSRVMTRSVSPPALVPASFGTLCKWSTWKHKRRLCLWQSEGTKKIQLGSFGFKAVFKKILEIKH